MKPTYYYHRLRGRNKRNTVNRFHIQYVSKLTDPRPKSASSSDKHWGLLTVTTTVSTAMFRFTTEQCQSIEEDYEMELKARLKGSKCTSTSDNIFTFTSAWLLGTFYQISNTDLRFTLFMISIVQKINCFTEMHITMWSKWQMFCFYKSAVLFVSH